MSDRSLLRTLASQIDAVARDHLCFSQVYEIIRVATDHISALALIEEFHRTMTAEPMTIDEMIALTMVRDKLKTDVNWRGPNDRQARYVVLDREEAEILLPIIERALTEAEHGATGK